MNAKAAAGFAARYCGKLTRVSRSNFYVSFLFLPKKKRDAIHAVYAFCRVVDDSVDKAGDVEARTKQLDRWKRYLEDAYRGRAVHPVMIQLIRTINAFGLPKEYFEKLIEGVSMDLTKTRYETFEEVRSYCYRVASVVGLICIKIFGYQNPKMPQYAENLGMALQWTNILRDLGKDAKMGRIYLPREDLRKFGMTEEDILQGRLSENYRALMDFEARRAESYYREAEALWDPADLRTMFPAEIMKAVYQRLLAKIRACNFDVYTQEMALPGFLKLAIACKIYVRAKVS